MDDLMGLAAVITAVLTPVVLIYLAHLNKKVTQQAAAIQHIDHAVNGKAPGAQSMVSQVNDIHHTVTESAT